MTKRIGTKTAWTLAAAALASLGLTATSATAATLLSIEFNEDDQAGFDLWPSAFAGTESIAEFTTDSVATSGTTTVTVTTNTGFGTPANRGSVDGNPVGYSYQRLYEDLLIASSPTGALTLDVVGLNPNQQYFFSLYTWDPGDNGNTSAPVKEWTVTGGTGVPSVATIDWDQPLVDNESYALVFEITTTATGTFQLTNTDGLPQSAINGFTLEPVPEPSAAVLAALGILGLVTRRRR